MSESLSYNLMHFTYRSDIYIGISTAPNRERNILN